MDAGERQRQAQAAVRAHLLAAGVFDVAQLCALRDDTDARATEDVIRRAGNAVLAIDLDGRVVYPAFQFNDRGAPREEISTLIAVLRGAGLGPWQTWTWLVEPTSMLSGGVPVEMMLSEPRRATKAAARMAARVGH